VRDQIVPLDELLDDICKEARLESSGCFSIDFAQAAEKMSRFRLSSPYEYVLKFVQSAVAGGAREVSVSVNRDQVVVLWDSVAMNRDQARELARHAAEPQRQGDLRALTHLAIGLEAVRALKPQTLEVVTYDSREGKGLHWIRTPKGEKLAELQGGVPHGDRTRVTISGAQRPSLRPSGPAWSGWLDDYASRSLGDYGAEVRSLVDSEYSQVWRRCLFAPIPVVLNGRAVNRPFFGMPKTLTSMNRSRVMNVIHPQDRDRFAGMRCLVASKSGRGLIPAPIGMCQSFRDWLESATFPSRAREFKQASPASRRGLTHLTVMDQPCVGCHALLAQLRPGMFSKSLGWLAFAKDGVVLSKIWNPVASLRQWCGVVSAQDLQVDLSEFGLLQDKLYRQCLKNLETMVFQKSS